MTQDDVGHSPRVNATAGKATLKIPGKCKICTIAFVLSNFSQLGPSKTCRTILLSKMLLKDFPFLNLNEN